MAMYWHDLAEMIGLPRSATSTQILDRLYAKLSEPGNSTSPVGDPDDPQGEFHALAQRSAGVLGISLADAYSRVAREAPTLAERARNRAMN